MHLIDKTRDNLILSGMLAALGKAFWPLLG